MSSSNIDDVQHWVDVYAELVQFKGTLLAELRHERGRVGAEGQAELDNDEELLRDEADRLKRRLEYWQRKLAN